MMFSDNIAMLCHESMSVSGNGGYGELPAKALELRQSFFETAWILHLRCYSWTAESFYNDVRAQAHHKVAASG